MLLILAMLTALHGGEPERIVDERQLNCLTKVVYHEARGEPELGQIAVAQVVINRKNRTDFPDDICEVIYQPKQFTDIQHTIPNKQSPYWAQAKFVAERVYAQKVADPTNGAIFFYNPQKAKKPGCFKEKKVRISNHDFYI